MLTISVASALLFLMALAPLAFGDETTYTFNIPDPGTGTLTLQLNNSAAIVVTIDMPTGFALGAFGFGTAVTGLSSSDQLNLGTLGGLPGIQWVVTATGTAVSFTLSSTSGFTTVDQLNALGIEYIASDGSIGYLGVGPNAVPEEPPIILVGTGLLFLGLVLKWRSLRRFLPGLS